MENMSEDVSRKILVNKTFEITRPYHVKNISKSVDGHNIYDVESIRSSMLDVPDEDDVIDVDITVNFEKWMCEFCKKEFDWICVNNIIITGGPSMLLHKGVLREGCWECVDELPDPTPTKQWLDAQRKEKV
jgi:hypothetical protein